MFRLVVASLLALTVGWKVALTLTNTRDERDDFKPALIELLVRSSGFRRAEIHTAWDGNRGRLPVVISGRDNQVWNQDIIKDFASADTRRFLRVPPGGLHEPADLVDCCQ